MILINLNFNQMMLILGGVIGVLVIVVIGK